MLPAPNAMSALSEQYRKQSEQQNQMKQNEINRGEFEKNAMTAQKYALNQSYMMQGNPNNPRTVTDTSMTIGNGGTISGGQINHSSTQGGTMKQLPPNLEGRYMNLLEQGPKPYAPPSGLDMSMPGNVQMGAANFSPGDATAYQDAAFSRLKDKSGQIGRSAVDSLSSELAGRGISGASGTFARGVGQRISEAVQPLADLNVARLGQEYDASQHARDLAEQRSQAEYSGGIAQRGQSISQQNALNALKMDLSDRQYNSQQNDQNFFLQMLSRYL